MAQHSKSANRFGARYGRKTRKKFGQIEAKQHAKHKSPFCNKLSVKRLAMGIWYCKKTGIKFAGKAYTPK